MTKPTKGRPDLPKSESRKPEAMISREREFLPAAIEIMETPPSPTARIFSIAVCVFLSLAMLWAWFGRIEIHAVAQGRIVPSGKVKPVQPLESAAVRAIHVAAGDHVNAGDLLIELDPTEDAATRVQIERELEAAVVNATRLRTEMSAANADDPDSVIKQVTWPLDDEIYRRESLVLQASIARMQAESASIDARIAQQRSTQQRVTASVDERLNLVKVLKERMAQQERLAKRGVAARTETLQIAGALHEAQAELENERGAIAEADAAIAALNKNKVEVKSQFVAERAEQLAELERRIDGLSQDLIKAIAREERRQIAAPVSGTVQQLAVASVGQVVTTGQQMMIIVPDGVGLEVEAMILNKDMGFVEVGQDAVVKVEAFPYTKYGTLPGEIRLISNDAVSAGQSPDAPVASPVDPGTADPRGNTGGGLVFPAMVALGSNVIFADGREISMTPGMGVTVEVKTGERRVIEYLLTPLLRYREEALRER
ncbi:MAG: HlyD family type I secretion periplasmic adaptor subunit [Pseudomonadota bacterium]